MLVIVGGVHRTHDTIDMRATAAV